MSTTTTLKICCKHSVAIQDGPIHDGERLICSCGDELFYSTNAGWRYRYQTVPPALTEAEAQLVIGAIPLQALPEQPAREGDEWHTEWVSSLETVIRNQHGTKIGLFVEQKHAEQAVTDHTRAALVPGLVEALKQCKTELECSMMTDGRDAAIRASGGALAAARKAGVE